MTTYRGIAIERATVVQVGYCTPTGERGKGRKAQGWAFTIDGYERVKSTLGEAKRAIDSEMQGRDA